MQPIDEFYFIKSRESHHFIYELAIGVLNTLNNFDFSDELAPLYYHDIANWLKNTDIPLNLKEYRE
jgi:hypothetical protein